MLDIEKLYKMEYEDLKKYLLYKCDNEARHQILSHRTIKEKLINSDNRHLFTWLVNDDIDGKILPLILDAEGLEILKQSTYSYDRLGALLQCGNKFLSALFSNEEFSKYVLDNLDNVFYNLGNLEEEASVKFVNYAIRKAPDKTVGILSHISDESCTKILKNLYLTRNQTKSLMVSLNKKGFEQIVNTTMYIDLLDSFDFYQLIKVFSHNIHLSDRLINNKDFVEKISTMFDPKVYRFLVDKIEPASDATKIEEARHEFYDEQIKGFDKESGMLPIFKSIYDKVIEFNSGDYSINDIYNCVKDYNFFGSEDLVFTYSNEIIHLFKKTEKLQEYFREQSRALLTDIIIDYHFKENYDTVLKDMKQMVEFQSSSGVIKEDRLKAYIDILSLDDMEYDQCVELHNRLKSSNWIENFYDDYSDSKSKVADMINDVILTEEKLSKYRIPYSDEVGVNIYVLDGDPFYALVKSYKTLKKNSILTKDSIIHTPTSSISLDSSDKLNTFGDPRECYNVIYSRMIPNQLIHSYPVDSFTSPSKTQNGYESSSRINQLLAPEQLVRSSPHYNELFITERPDYKKEYSYLEQLPILGIYCYDNITEQDIESARNLGVGIVCVKTKAYTPFRDENQINMQDRILMTKEDSIENEYLIDVTENPSIDRKK